MRRCFANVSATRDVSHVIHRRPNFSALAAVVPEPQVGSKTRSPGSVVITRHLSTTLGLVSTTYRFFLPNPLIAVSFQMQSISTTGKSSRYLLYRRVLPTSISRLAVASLAIPPVLTPGFQWLLAGHSKRCPRHSKNRSLGSEGPPCE